MLSLKEMDVRNLKLVGKGRYGSVYKVNDDLAVKLYNDSDKFVFGNPNLRKKRRALKIKRIGKDIHYSDLVKDLAYVDGRYAGIVIPYYDGSVLCKMMDAPFELKMEISRQLVRNCKELTEHHIYPTDFKLNNMMYVDGEAKLIDLDDTFTKYFYINSEVYRKDAIAGLDECIKAFFGDYAYGCYFNWLRLFLSREIPETMTEYSDIDSYLDEKEVPSKYLFIYTDSDIEEIKRIVREDDYKFVLICRDSILREDNYVDFFNEMGRHGLNVYDAVRDNNIDLFFSNNKTESIQYVKRR